MMPAFLDLQILFPPAAAIPAPPPPAGGQLQLRDALMDELVSYLMSAQASIALPVEVAALHRRILRSQQAPCLTALGPEFLGAYFNDLARAGALSLEEVTVGHKSLTMVVAIHGTTLASLQGLLRSCLRQHPTPVTPPHHARAASETAEGEASSGSGSKRPRITPRAVGTPPAAAASAPTMPRTPSKPAPPPAAAATGREILDLLARPTALEESVAETFRKGGAAVQEYCPHGTRQACMERSRGPGRAQPAWCIKIHFRPLILPHTNLSLGDCSYLSTCRRMNTCKFVHYEIDEGDVRDPLPVPTSGSKLVKTPPVRPVSGPSVVMPVRRRLYFSSR
jgi:hypothetical protein